MTSDLAWPMWAESYTVGPQLYQVTVGGARGTNTSCNRWEGKSTAHSLALDPKPLEEM